MATAFIRLEGAVDGGGRRGDRLSTSKGVRFRGKWTPYSRTEAFLLVRGQVSF